MPRGLTGGLRHTVRPCRSRRTTTAPERRSAFSEERLKRIDALLQRYADEQQIGGVVALVLEHGQPVYEGAIGWRDREAGVKMTSDIIVERASGMPLD